MCNDAVKNAPATIKNAQQATLQAERFYDLQ